MDEKKYKGSEAAGSYRKATSFQGFVFYQFNDRHTISLINFIFSCIDEI